MAHAEMTTPNPVSSQVLNAAVHQFFLGDNRDVLPTLADCSVDAIVCDPPYELGFMGKKWDATGIAYNIAVWQECLRVLKPGGYLLAFGGTRTSHRLTCAIEDAGFEIRDSIAWIYGSGFPKSMDVSKALDKAAGKEREVIGTARGGSAMKMDDANSRPWHKRQAERGGEYDITAPATHEAHEWQGWGTALKPAIEPITVGRKPLEGTVCENVLKHGTGAINIDACRVGETGARNNGCKAGADGYAKNDIYGKYKPSERVDYNKGRFPSNIIHDESDEVLEAFAAFGEKTSGVPGISRSGVNRSATYGAESRPAGTQMSGFGDSGSAARFFYSAKASGDEREGNDHPTVKPVSLMRWLCRLVCRPGGVVLDPFMGSGSTGVAAIAEDMRFIGIEQEAKYHAIAEHRLQYATRQTKLDLFGGSE